MKYFTSLLFATIALASSGQSNFTVNFDHVALSVQDLDRASDFYSSVLNLSEITNKTQNKGIRWFSLGEGKELHLISVVQGKVILNKAVHFAIKVSDFNAFVKRLEDLQIGYQSWNEEPGKVTIRPDGIRQVYVRDPDGYWIEVNSTE